MGLGAYCTAALRLQEQYWAIQASKGFFEGSRGSELRAFFGV